MDHFEQEIFVMIQCEMPGDDQRQELEVGMSWSIGNIWKELEVYLGKKLNFHLVILDGVIL